MNTVNIIFFFTINFAFIGLIAKSVWNIRHIHDRLDIKQEMTYIVLAWTVFSMLQYVAYFGEQLNECSNLFNIQPSQLMVYLAQLWTYITIVLRDFIILLITIYFLIVVNKRENDIKTVLAKKDTVLDLMDLETVLSSVTPIIAFTNYIDDKREELSPLLRFVKCSKIFYDHLD